MIREDDEPPVCHTLMEPASRFWQFEQRHRAPAGSGRNATSRCALWPHRRHSMKMVWAPFATAQAYGWTPRHQQPRRPGTVWVRHV